MQIDVNMKTISIIIAILGIILGIIGGIDAIRLSVLSTDLVWNGLLALIMSILAIVGVLIFSKNMKMGSVQFIVSGIGIFIAIYLYGIYGAICLIVAGILGFVANMESDEEQEDNKMFLLLPVATVAIIFIVLIGSVAFGAIDMSTSSNAISVDNINSNIKTEYGSTSGEFKGNLHTDKEFSYLTVQVEFFDENGVSLSKTYGFTQNNVKPGVYEFSAYYYGSKIPSKAVIEVSSDFGGEPIYTHNVTIN
ncbi:hypothetical protein [Methanobrevibacter sp. DSM 116169]|uniref:hypothetical protein n=1 Tax=Methanobrevibacter sp. DSM 116169 TaxID=3242727 RepID=UPI0038FC942F